MTNFGWGAEEGILVFLFVCKLALFQSAPEVSTGSTSAKHEGKRLQLIYWKEKKVIHSLQTY